MVIWEYNLYIFVHNMDKMIEVKVGEFRAGLKKYLRMLEDGEVVCVGGCSLVKEGSIDNNIMVPDPGDRYGTSVEEVGERLNKIIEKMPELDLDIILCDLCGGGADYEFWEEGEEKRVCDVCVRRKFGRGADRVIKGYSKITK